MEYTEEYYTFGNSKCAIELYDIIKNDSKAIKKVGNFLKQYFFIINNISKLEDERAKKPLLISWHQTNLKILENDYQYLHKDVKSRVRNLIVAKNRISIKNVRN